MNKIKIILSTPWIVFTLIALISFASLAAAFIAEGLLELEPCILCIYQRYPFALGLLLGLIGLALRNNKSVAVALLGICSINFLLNSLIAAYHTGVEQHWWKSAVEGCSVVFLDNSHTKSILENIMSAPMGDCSKIPWQDPILGLSMANYNIALCFGLFIFCIVSAVMVAKSKLLHSEAS
ncbi:MAG: disulfide bond formation protein B [Alphaproteobacteria bacterium]|nr:MAG: disulfide bond formation protein B [Alphaproteobacteria bacterium]